MRSAEHAPSPENDSNRGQGESQIYSNKSWGYVGSDGKRWDTSGLYLNKFPLRTVSFGGRRLFRREDVENFANDFGRCQSPSPDAPASPKTRGRGRPRNTGMKRKD
jgi:hypothetical protein